MIARKLQVSINESFGYLAQRLAVKASDLWIVNSLGGETIDDLDLAIIDIENTQSWNRGAKTAKTYHLLVSFGSDQPSPEALRDIEGEFAKALGFEDHQRVVAIYRDADGFQMNIAYNRVHPETFVACGPRQDFRMLSVVCGLMEKKYGLPVEKRKRVR